MNDFLHCPVLYNLAILLHDQWVKWMGKICGTLFPDKLRAQMFHQQVFVSVNIEISFLKYSHSKPELFVFVWIDLWSHYVLWQANSNTKCDFNVKRNHILRFAKMLVFCLDLIRKESKYPLHNSKCIPKSWS